MCRICTEKGYTTHTCACGDSYVDTYTDALGHDYEDVVTAPTCTEKGSTTHTCKRCGDTHTDSETDALGHDYTDVVTAPTCGEQGYTTHTCKRCGDTFVDTYVEATGQHDDGEWVVVKEPDVGVAGLKELRCTKCGHVLDTEEIEMLTTDGVDSVYYIQVANEDGSGYHEEMVVGHYNEEEAQEMLKLVNEYRTSIDMPTFAMTSTTMNEFAALRAVETSYLWDHMRPIGGRGSYAENIAMGPVDAKGNNPSVQEIFNAWLNSEGHKINLDDPRVYNLTGISVFYKKVPIYKDGVETGSYVYISYWVEIFR